MSIYLDLGRAGAALVVLVGHAGQLGLLGAAWPFDDTFQHSAVIFFFVLSGLMIQQSASRPNQTLATYAKARMARIVPVALFSLLLSTGTFLLLVRAGLHVADETRYNHLSASTIMMPLIFVSERLDGVGPPLNPPFWSLCYEVWFYTTFGLYSFSRGPIRIVSIALAIVAADGLVWLLMPAWLIGVALGKRGNDVRITHPRCTFAVSITLFAFSQWSGLPHTVAEPSNSLDFNFMQLRFSSYFITDTIGAVFIGCALAALRHISGDLHRWQAIAKGFAGITFTLYLTHWPLLIAIQTLTHSGSTILRASCAIFLPIAVAILLAPLLEVRLPRLFRGQSMAILSSRGLQRQVFTR
ncbi:acyltransferase family protein [Sphingomonas rubra]|uniref:Peptidoglycan/LPS O-acetylase OafA/YrhL, contains acyltransferase and SGNH-hydrolase domains n=1 Tax=Sphingomonas rubra TaxID=634430 RepID=A0A1I5PQJ9_9SPHN|nr:acyltransferase [Sphingomonas rubra]SFP36408.1 Peptidoglycan/LPS O-acetylase OafA/YrhL, contains acyltransferase and SGNH-hydrolase domains [Sphingomonas rubra]